MVVRSLRVIDRDNCTVELRVGAVYQMLAYMGAIVARLSDDDAYQRERATIDTILASARPHLWSHEPACFAQWFELEAQ